MRRVLAVAAALVAVAACTPREQRAWLRWHRHDPEAAVEYLYDIGLADRPQPRDGSGDVYWPWTELAQCESGGNWQINTGNGYYGGLQFALGSWRATGGTGYPHHASPAEQVRRGEILQDMQGWGAWPACSRKVGLR